VTVPGNDQQADDEHLGGTPALGERAVRGSLWSLTATFVLLPVNLLAGIVLARLLGPADFGQFVVLITFLAVVGPFVDLGFGASLLQWAGAAAGRGDRRAIDRLFNQNLGMQLLVPLPITMLGGLFILRDSSAPVVSAFVMTGLLGVLVGSGLARLAVENRTAALAKLGLIGGLLSNGVAVGLAFAGGEPETLWVARSSAALLPALPLLWLLSSSERRALLRPRLPARMPSGFWPFARGAWVAAGLGALVGTRSEVFVLELNGLDAAVGVFAVAFGLATQLTSPLDIMQGSFGPAATALAGRRPGSLGDVMMPALRLFGLGSGLVLAGSTVVISLVPVVYGPEYAQVPVLLVPLLVASCLQTALAPYSALAVVRRRRRLLPWVQAATATADLGLAFLLTPLVGIWGAVVGSCAGLVLINLLFAFFELRSWRQVAAVVLRSGLLEGLLVFIGGLLVVWWLGSGVIAAGVVGVLALGGFAAVVLIARRQELSLAVSDLEPLLPPRLGRLVGKAARRLGVL